MAETIVDDELWDEFHRLVNMTSADLQDWLAVEESGEVAEGLPDQAGTVSSRTVLQVMSKRRTDLTGDDVTTMQNVVDTIRAQRGDDPEPAAGDAAWRRRLMRIGHDPLKEV